MFARLLVIFITIPLIELYLLVKVGGYIGAPATICLVILTGILGAALARSQGYSIVSRMQAVIREGRPPTDELIEGVLVLLGGIVLLTPGLLTDLAGFALMVPGIRRLARNGLKKRIAAQTISNFRMNTSSDSKSEYRDDDVIDV